MMKALTLYHPFPELIALGQKKNETRGWATNYRGPIAIHCATSRRPWHMNLAFDEPFYSALEPLHREIGGKKAMRLHLGCVLAIGNLVNCLEINSSQVYYLKKDNPNEYAFGDYSIGRFAWLLKDIHQLAVPIPAKGMQRIWNWDETEHLVAIDPFSIGSTKIWTPKGVISGRKLERPDEDAVRGLEVA